MSRLHPHLVSKHKKEGAFKCTETDCPESYAAKSWMKQHLVEKHNATEGAFKCTEKGCPESFAVMSRLHPHLVEKHKNEGAFKCTETDCPVSFADKVTG